YRAKQRGRGRYRRFTRDMDASVKLRLDMEVELRRAIAHDELSVAYQPIVRTADGSIAGVEALLRWHHPERGLLPPAGFLDALEASPLARDVGTWVLRTACAQAA
ncbi:EAL domain-containing protein, partial [Enterococcus faecalis]|uniref:EAL domain-containing protein n=1 Tax=Enterococcus faecalis TaxID=1351 RepID=UPI00403F2B1E